MADRQIGRYQPRAILGAGGVAAHLINRAARGDFDNAARQVRQRARQLYDSWERSRVPPHRPQNVGVNMPRPQGGSGYAGYRSGRFNRIISRKRGRSRGRRRKLRFGTQVRKQALGLFEGKRYGRVQAFNGVLSNVMSRFEPMDLMTTYETPAADTAQGMLTIPTGLRQGLKIFVRGIRIQLHIRNNQATQPVDVRIICGWRKHSALGKALLDPPAEYYHWIFKNRSTTQEPVALNATTEFLNMPCSTVMAPLASSKHFVCAKDMVIRLGANNGGDENAGENFHLMKIWWELNNKINKLEKDDTDSVPGDAEQLMDWYPVVYVYHTDPSNVTPTSDVTYNFYSKVYWKDPLG